MTLDCANFCDNHLPMAGRTPLAFPFGGRCSVGVCLKEPLGLLQKQRLQIRHQIQVTLHSGLLHLTRPWFAHSHVKIRDHPPSKVWSGSHRQRRRFVSTL